jgi:hypothetical protein
MEKTVEDLERKVSRLVDLRTRTEEYRRISETVKRYLDEIEIVRSTMEKLDGKIQSYDIIDFINSDMVETDRISLEMANTAMKDIGDAVAQFTEEGSEEYVEKSNAARDKIMKAGIERAVEAAGRPVEQLMNDGSFVELVGMLDYRSIRRVQMTVLRRRKAECERKKLYFTRNKNFLYRSMVFQELMMYLKLFPSELRMMNEVLRSHRVLPRAEDLTPFEGFSLSVLKSYFHELNYKELVLMKDALGKQAEKEDVSYEAMVDVLMSNAIAIYIEAMGEPESGGSDVVEI